MVRSLYRRLSRFVRGFLGESRSIARNNVSSSKSATRGGKGVKLQQVSRRTSGALIATGIFHPLGLWPFDRTVQIPVGGVKPVRARALRLVKPEGIVFRSRTYTRFAGQTLHKVGFLDEMVRQLFNQRGGQGPTSLRQFVNGFAGSVARQVSSRFRRSGFRVSRRG